MTSFLKKFQILKKKGMESNEGAPENKQGLRDNWEAHSSNTQPPSSQDPASQRTSQLLPLLVKPPPALADTKKKAQTQSQPLILPELVQRQPNKAAPVASRMDERHQHRLSTDYSKDQTMLPKLLAKEKLKRTIIPPAKKKPPDFFMPIYPELSDEQFRYLWDSKKLQRGRTLKESLEMLDEREVLDTILAQLQQDPRQARKKSIVMLPPETTVASQKTPVQQKITKTPGQEKNSLYKYYGVKLRDSSSKEVVSEYLHMLLRLSVEDEIDREGISEAVGLAAFCHLTEILMVLRDYGHMTPTRKSAQTEHENTGERQMSTTLILCYGQAAMGAKPEEMLLFIEAIVSEILFQFRGTNKDEMLKKTFMRSVIMISKALLNSKREDVQFPRKSELVICIIELIDDEPLGSFSITILHQAMITVTFMTPLQPPLDSEVRSELVGKSVKKVFSLPSLKMTKVKAGSPLQPMQTQDFYQQTINACLSMLTSLLSEVPSLDALQDILMHTNGWIESQKSYERERAVRSTSQLLKFVSEHFEFDTSQEFSLLGQLVALLALHTADSIKEIGQQSAEAMYHLHYIMMTKLAKEVEKKRKNKKGNVVKWFREDFFISGPTIFYNNISKVAKAFGEHLTPSQITDLALKAIDSLTHEDKAISQAAGILLSSFLEECGMDMEDLPMIIKEIYHHLERIIDPVTKEQTLKAVCNLASKRLNGVVDILLECSLECDDSVAEIWKALVADPYSNIKLMRPLLKRLQDEDPLSEVTFRRHSKSQMPMAATNALCLILSLPEAADTLQNKFPHLLLALVTQIYFVIGSGRKGSKRTSLGTDAPVRLTPLSTAVQALKNLIACAGYIREYNILGMQGCWDMLSTPETYFDGIFHLARTLFAFSKVHLRMTFKQANTYLRRPDAKERTIGMAFFTELLFHPEVGLFFVKQDILDVLREWMVQTSVLMQIFSIRGLGYILQHPLEDEVVEPFLYPLINCATDPDKNIAKESIKSLQYLFNHLDVEEYGFMGINLLFHLLKHFNDEDNELQKSSIVLYGLLLRGVKEEQRNIAVEDVLKSLVPLIIQLTDPYSGEVSKSVLTTCANFMRMSEVPNDLFEFTAQDKLYNKYFNISKYMLWRYTQKLPEMLAQMIQYMKSRNPLYREAAAILIACNVQCMKPDVVSAKQVEDVYLALRDLQGDCEACVSNAAVASIEELFKHCGSRINPKIVPSQLVLSMLKNNIAKH